MDAVEFLDKVDRLSKRGSTEEKMRYNDYRTAGDNTWAVKFVEHWCTEHPAKTRQSVFLKQWPDARINDVDGVLEIQPCKLNRDMSATCQCTPCVVCRKAFWLAEVEE